MSSTARSIVMYGLNQCDTCRKARRYLDHLGVRYRFIDLRTEAALTTGELDDALITRWLNQVGWETLLNRRSTTWRQLSDDERAALDAVKARSLLTRYPTLLKRPILEQDRTVIVGFDELRYQALSSA